MRTPALLNRGCPGFDALKREISDRELRGCGRGMMADVGIHANVLMKWNVRRRLADAPSPPCRSAAVKAARERACEHGRSPRAGLDGENGGANCPFKASPPPFGFLRPQDIQHS